FPYLNDKDGNGYRSLGPIRNRNGDVLLGRNGNILYRFSERKEGFFRALGDASTKLGIAGSLKVGIDFGKNFKAQPTLSLGYFFYYFSSGIQLMSPYKPVFDQSDHNRLLPNKKKKFFGKKSYYGTPQITFSFSGWW